jgi:4-diphosphocytidyl-2-C-methyl-D-erythritol kinase
MRLAAPAKINLYLEVVGRREDDYHELVTVLQTIDLADEVELAVRARRPEVPAGVADVAFELVLPEREGDAAPRGAAGAATVPSDDQNLAVRAAVDWLSAAGMRDQVGVDLRLLKRIPAGAGLGGGSSDAAAVLIGLQRLLGAGAGPALAPLAAGLGSDVAFFLVGGTALCLGRGEHVFPIAEPDPFDLMLGFPDFPVPTPAVYGSLAAPALTASRSTEGAAEALVDTWTRRLAGATLDDLRTLYRNDLEAPACRVRSELVDLLSSPDIHLSGSGSTLFLFGSEPPPDSSACRRTSMRFVRHRSRKR